MTTTIARYKPGADPITDQDGNVILMDVRDEDREFFRENVQVYIPGKRGLRDRQMTRTALRAAVVAGKAEKWQVLDVDFETGEMRLLCPYCALGIYHIGTTH
jgi:hypothetical protein